MAYISLYRKWRPRLFGEVVGQEHITRTLKSQSETGRIAHAYIFGGSRGTGKTSCARIFAKAVNCKSPKEGEPCLECENCIAAEKGSLLDVEEIDAASNNGVDNIRQLREEANYVPTSSKYRVYIIDEAHMLSAGAANALLKIMEEPPGHVIFILATTEMNKVLPTILSRCQRFDFCRIDSEIIAERLRLVGQEDGIEITEDAANLIARLADGGMRDALSILESCVSFQGGKVDEEAVARVAGLAGRGVLFDMLNCACARDLPGALRLCSELYAGGKDMRVFCGELLDAYRKVLLKKSGADFGTGSAVTKQDYDRIKHLADKMSMEGIVRAIDLLGALYDKLSRPGSARTEVEICLVRLCSEETSNSADDLLSRIAKLEDKLNILAANGFAQPSAAGKPSAKAKKPDRKSTRLNSSH